MKVIILAGGRGTRISEESALKPKPMITIGERPILWHIMKTYSLHGVNEFIICLGYKGYVIKEFFANYMLHNADIVRLDLRQPSMKFSGLQTEPWVVTLLETGRDTETGGRIKRAHDLVKDDEAFCLTYGDGLSNVNISKLISFHSEHGKLATVTTVQPPGRFGSIETEDGGKVTKFQEKPVGDGHSINGGFFVLSPKVMDYIEDDQTIWEREPLENLARKGQLFSYPHSGFWQPMDTLRERNLLVDLWREGDPPWLVKNES